MTRNVHARLISLGSPICATRRRRFLAASILYVIVIGVWFGPLIVHLGSAVISGPGDGTLTIRDYAWTTHVGQNIFSTPHDFGVGAPQGEKGDAAVSLSTPLQAEFVTLVGRAIGYVAAWNVFLLFGFVATAIGTFAVLEEIGVGFLPALFGGYVFAFNPWHYEKAIEGHAMLAQTWVFPLLFWALLRLQKTNRILSAAVVGAVLGVAFYTSAYFLLFGAVMAVVFLVCDLVVARRATQLWLWVFAGAVTAALIAPFALFATVTSDVTTVDRPTTDLQRFGAEPIEYVLPSFRHPVFGHLISKIYAANDTRHFAEPTLYFGLTTIVLAVVGLIVTLRRRGDQQRRLLAVFGGALVIVAFLMSLPRKVTIASLSIPAPAYVIGEVTTLWRVYARFAVVVGFGLVILAALGAQYLQRRTGRSWPLLLVFAVAIFELAVTIPLPIWSTSPPPYVRWLTRATPGIVAEYPMFDYKAAGVANEAADYFWQWKDGHPLFNIYGDPYRAPLSARAIRAAAIDLSASDTPSILAREGVRYVVAHDAVYRHDGLAVPKLAPGLTLVWHGDDIRIARVVAHPIRVRPIVAKQPLELARIIGGVPALASFTGQNSAGAFAGNPQWLKIVGPTGVTINDPDLGYDWGFELRVRVRAPGFAGRLNLFSGDHLLASARFGANGAPVTIGSFPLRFGVQTLRLVSVPAATPAQPIGLFSVAIVDPRIPPSAIAAIR